MAICKVCKRDMLDCLGCKRGAIVYGDGKFVQEDEYVRIRYGEEPRGPFDDIDEDDRCPDCNCKLGYFHHWGCDQEICPRCGEQLLSCDCPSPVLSVSRFELDGKIKGGQYERFGLFEEG